MNSLKKDALRGIAFLLPPLAGCHLGPVVETPRSSKIVANESCVSDPVLDARARSSEGPEGSGIADERSSSDFLNRPLEPASLPDLDGDDEPDVFVADPYAGGTGNWPNYFYVSNHGCLTFAGLIWGGEVTVSGGDEGHTAIFYIAKSDGQAGTDDESGTVYYWDYSEHRLVAE